MLAKKGPTTSGATVPLKCFSLGNDTDEDGDEDGGSFPLIDGDHRYQGQGCAPFLANIELLNPRKIRILP